LVERHRRQRFDFYRLIAVAACLIGRCSIRTSDALAAASQANVREMKSIEQFS